jgi:hypothetical protein
VIVKGETNVWATPMPLIGTYSEDEAELFDRPAELARDSGVGLVLRRYFAFDLVPRQPGTLTIPEIEVAYFEPEAGRYQIARTAPFEITVTGPEAGREHTEAAPRPAGGAPASRGEPEEHWWMLALGAGVLAAGALFLRRRLSRTGDGNGKVSLAALREALASGEPEEAAACAARALRETLEAAQPGGAPGRPAEELAAASGPPELRADAVLLVQLDAARFGSADAERLLALAREAELRLRGR